MAVELDLDELAKRFSEGDDRIPISLSSEAPVERSFGTEILDHSPESVDLTYARDGLPFLLNHNTDIQIGLIEDVRVEGGRVHGRVRQGNHPDASHVFADIRQGIRKNISVGYRVDRLTPDEKRSGTFRAAWTPMEGSTVPVPADINVGVGRDTGGAVFPVEVVVPEPTTAPKAEQTERKMSENASGAVPTVTGPSAEDTRKAMVEIINLAREHNMVEHVEGWLSRSMSPDAVAKEILARKRENVKPTEAPAGHIDLTQREHRTYNLANAIGMAADAMRGQGKFEGLEREVSDEIAKRTGKAPRGLYVPLNVQKPFVDTSSRASLTGQTAGTSSLGGAAVQTDILSLIDLLRNRMQVRALGATVLTGLSNNISFPRQITANTFNWTGENPSSANTPGKGTFDNVTLTPKTGMVSTAYSRQLLLQSSFDVSSWVANDIAAVNALGVDLAAIEGTGTTQPTGIYTQTGVTAITLGSNGAALDWDDIVNFETQVAANNADIGPMAFLTSPVVRGKLLTTLRSTTAGSQYLWTDENTMRGYPAVASNQIRNNYTTGTSTTICSGMIFGVWSELIVGEFGGAMELIIDPYTGAGQNMIVVHSVLMVDVAVKHPKAFAFTKEILTA